MSQEAPLGSLDLVIWIGAETRAVFECWVRPERFTRWFQHSARVFSPDEPSIDKPQASSGDCYEWGLVHGHRSGGEFLNVDEQSRLIEFSFGPAGAAAATVRIEGSDGGSVVRLSHRGVAAADRADVQAGWTFYLTNLKAFLEHGVDLREHSAGRIRGGALNI